MICICLAHKQLPEILHVLEQPGAMMAEIRLDSCPLSEEDIRELFAQSDVPLIATCRAAELARERGADAPEEADWEQAQQRLSCAVQAGARFADLEIEAPSPVSIRFQQLCRQNGTELIRSYHDFTGTPDAGQLQKILARCFRYGADIAKIVTTACSEEDTRRVGALYSIVLEDQDSMQGRLVAFCMGEAGRQTRLDCLRRGAPFTYCALTEQEGTAPGQWLAEDLRQKVYGDAPVFRPARLAMPASKSFAQRAIIAAALASGTSRLSGYTPCDDSEAALSVARTIGATVHKNGRMLEIIGIGETLAAGLQLERLDVGESGLLTRLMIPLLAALNRKSVTVTGRGTLPDRPLEGAGSILAAFGVLLENAAENRQTAKEAYVPVRIQGTLIPGNADIPGSGGSQLISGLLMALPLCAKHTTLHVSTPKSIPYMYITLDVLRRFGIKTRSELEGDAQMLEAQDWSSCTGILFRTQGGQRYRAADFALEGDWSAAANFLVAGAVFGAVEIEGLDLKSLQADLAVIDILVEAGAVVSELEDGTVCVRQAPLESFTTDLNNAPDLFPIIALLAAFCAGESRIAGVGRLAGKESNRADGIVTMFRQMGVEIEVDGDVMVIEGESLASRRLNHRLLKGGDYTSRHDHRLAMTLQVASLGADGPVRIDDPDCVAKSFPDFFACFAGKAA